MGSRLLLIREERRGRERRPGEDRCRSFLHHLLHERASNCGHARGRLETRRQPRLDERQATKGAGSEAAEEIAHAPTISR
jgi:hypothetical protein